MPLTTSVLLLASVLAGLFEGLLQACWVRPYFRHGIPLHGKRMDDVTVRPVTLEIQKNALLRNVELKQVGSEKFIFRQGKRGISRNSFFYGCAHIDRAGGQVIVKTFVDASVLLFAMACGSWILDDPGLGIACGAALAWAAARYFIDDQFLVSIAECVHAEVRGESVAGTGASSSSWRVGADQAG